MKFKQVNEELLIELRQRRVLPPPKQVGFSGIQVISGIADHDAESSREAGYEYFGRGWQQKGDDPDQGLIYVNRVSTGSHGHPPNSQNQFYWGIYKDGKLHLSAKTQDVNIWLKKNSKYIAQLLFYGER